MSARFQKYVELNYIRVIAMVAVVIIHATTELFKHNADTLSIQVGAYINQLCRFSVPAFLIISGILAYQSYIEKNVNYVMFIRKKFIKLGIPFICWTILSTFFIEKFSLMTIALLIFGNGPFYQLYYIPLLFQLFIFLPFMKHFMERKRNLWLLGIITILIYTFFQSIWLGYFNPNIFIRAFPLFFPGWIMYFTIGFFAGKYYLTLKEKIESTPMERIICIFIISIIILFLDTYLNCAKVGFNIQLMHFFRPVVIVYSFSTILLLFRIGITKPSKKILYFYESSFAIYLCHMMVIIIIERITSGYLFSNIILTLLSTIISLAVSYLLYVSLSKTRFKILLAMG